MAQSQSVPTLVLQRSVSSTSTQPPVMSRAASTSTQSVVLVGQPVELLGALARGDEQMLRRDGSASPGRQSAQSLLSSASESDDDAGLHVRRVPRAAVVAPLRVWSSTDNLNEDEHWDKHDAEGVEKESEDELGDVLDPLAVLGESDGEEQPKAQVRSVRDLLKVVEQQQQYALTVRWPMLPWRPLPSLDIELAGRLVEVWAYLQSEYETDSPRHRQSDLRLHVLGVVVGAVRPPTEIPHWASTLVSLAQQAMLEAAGELTSLSQLPELCARLDEAVLGLLERLLLVSYGRVRLTWSKRVSKAWRRETERTENRDLIYGEISFGTMVELFSKHVVSIVPHGGEFWDLGSGTGRAALACSVLHSFERCCLVEFVEPLLVAFRHVQARWHEYLLATFGEDTPLPAYEPMQCDLRTTQLDVSRASFIFVNSTCYSDALMSRVAEICAGQQPNGVTVTLTKPLVSPVFRLVERRKMDFSWGTASVYVHVRTLELPSNDNEAGAT